MPQFDVHLNPNAGHANQPAYFLVLQCDFVDRLATLLIAPIYDPATIGPMPAKLAPIVSIQDKSYVVAMPQMAGIPRSRIGTPVGSLDGNRDEFIAAIDFLISGF